MFKIPNFIKVKYFSHFLKAIFVDPNASISKYMATKLITFKPTDDGKTKVIWSMKGENVPFGFRAFATFSGGFDAMIGPDFERGLERLDSLSTLEAN